MHVVLTITTNYRDMDSFQTDGLKLINILCKSCSNSILKCRSKHDTNGEYTFIFLNDACIRNEGAIFSELLSDVRNSSQVIMYSVKNTNSGLCTSTKEYKLSIK